MVERRSVWLCFAAATLVFVCVVVARVRPLWIFTVDDTFITLRYAHHLAEGLGPAWNPGGPRVEGCTTTLWMLLLAVPHLLGLNALMSAKLASVACALACGAVAAWLSLRVTRPLSAVAQAVGAVCTLVVSAAYGSLALHAVSGMETTLFALLLTVYFALALTFRNAPGPALARTLALVALLATLTRPEGSLVCGTSFVVLMVQAEKPARALLGRALLSWTIVPGLVYFGARFAYYGLPLPLPFYVKAQGQAGLAGAVDVAEFFAPFAVQQPYLATLMLIGLVRFRGLLLAPCAGALALALFFLLPAHIMGFEGRYLFPIFPLMGALLGAGAAHLTECSLRWLSTREAPRALSLVVPGALCLALAWHPLPESRDFEARRWIRYGEGLARAHIPLGRDLARLGQDGVRHVIALMDVGAIGYYGEWFTIDTYGLNDVRMALTKRGDIDYVFAQRPELVVVVSAVPGRYEQVFEFEAPLYQGAIRRGYSFACDYEFLPDYHLHVLARPESQRGQGLSCMKRLLSAR